MVAVELEVRARVGDGAWIELGTGDLHVARRPDRVEDVTPQVASALRAMADDLDGGADA